MSVKMHRRFLWVVLAAGCLGGTLAARADDKKGVEEGQRIQAATDVLTELTATPDRAIPQHLLERAEAIVVIPSLKKGGFIVGAKYGRGIMSVRDREHNAWSRPGFVTMAGGTIGWQIGVEAVDITLLVMNRGGIDDLLSDKFTIGGSGALVVGPVGRTVDAATDAKLQTQILAYSRAQGLFAGATLDGAALKGDTDSATAFYGRPMTLKETVMGGQAFSVAAGPAKAWHDLLHKITMPTRTESFGLNVAF